MSHEILGTFQFGSGVKKAQLEVRANGRSRLGSQSQAPLLLWTPRGSRRTVQMWVFSISFKLLHLVSFDCICKCHITWIKN